MVVVGSRGGSPRNPLWVGNILADPHCWLTIRRRRIPALARVATGAERERLYPLIAAQHPNLERYQERAAGFGREIPLVVLTRRD